MKLYEGHVREIRVSTDNSRVGWIECPDAALPSPGQFLQAWSKREWESPLAINLFPRIITEGGFQTATVLPETWVPGTTIQLRGPVGHGFQLPITIRRLALAAFGSSPAQLYPLIYLAINHEIAVTLFTDEAAYDLPPSVEIYPIIELRNALQWADQLAMHLPIQNLKELRKLLGVADNYSLPCPTQVLMETHYPCGGLAACGACAVPASRGWKKACIDGPVMNLGDLDW